ncbi:hypothetical protein GPU89_02565 [Burkholderia cepacia]|nr:hypothetical protein [Burkholderia cepacia]
MTTRSGRRGCWLAILVIGALMLLVAELIGIVASLVGQVWGRGVMRRTTDEYISGENNGKALVHDVEADRTAARGFRAGRIDERLRIGRRFDNGDGRAYGARLSCRFGFDIGPSIRS